MSTTDIASNLAKVQERIRSAERAAGREPGSVELLPVTKFHPCSSIEVLAAEGIRLVGENREQEASAKVATLREHGVDCGIAMIGQIQSKKANAVARWASEVHSVDSLKLAKGLERGMALALERGDRTSEILPCLVQVSADGDESRGGVAVEKIAELVEALEGAEHLQFDGFMVVPPLDANASEVFDQVRELRDTYAAKLGRPLRFSAGMSADFEEAIAHGSDVVRVGTAVMGPRPVV
ncbi:YggS family pyridoxal phosphate enzyme [Corynebacterium sp. NML98-0116]|uniref:Pyridoxal phosphate homeostasis protein n=2 Tax=Corynebacterium TaxID=1716 RepID=A0ABD4TNM9_9CORY|nr:MULTISPECIES: YggS family pyridoxal phosphate-dependent enzyme [Corynebacterium]AOX05352.1 YggS family pyridoxal phosphate enzyme [Corynebacterium sp. NML98-0116]MCO6393414.1 YggS family pyridoxal phosphate-dependent enzyme [Corynebacterium lipophilum]MCQ4613487.1 YggS family pyridoxal phosphate-dependent enzyme [Corynebacterium pseudogenitalium]MCZ2116668.1 YggS family pyridoxal phosphate-dependent enzyme [Corynebacterium lipophilum]UUA86590.1 YggS family pyridoxal phosphate-dependent enzy